MRKTIPCLLAAAIAAAGCGPGHELKVMAEDEPITPMVKLDPVTCDEDGDNARAEGVLTNVSDAEATFEIVVEFYDKAGAYYTGAAVPTAPLPPGATQTWEAEARAHGHGEAAIGGVCEVVEVYEIPPVEEYTDVAVDGS